MSFKDCMDKANCQEVRLPDAHRKQVIHVGKVVVSCYSKIKEADTSRDLS